MPPRRSRPSRAKPPARVRKIALVIGNGHYPDANAPLAQPINDARALTATLRKSGFDVDVVEDASKDDMRRAVARLQSKVKPDSVVMLFFGGYGVQARRESYMIPVDAQIWKEADVRRDGVSVESVLDAIHEKGARAKLVVVDASRRNPYERRFRAFSHGLAPITAPDNALILSSATPGKVADDSKSANSVLMTELLKHLNSHGRHRDRLQQDPRRHLPRHRRRTGAVGVVLAARRRQLHRRRRATRPAAKSSDVIRSDAQLRAGTSPACAGRDSRIANAENRSGLFTSPDRESRRASSDARRVRG